MNSAARPEKGSTPKNKDNRAEFSQVFIDIFLLSPIMNSLEMLSSAVYDSGN